MESQDKADCMEDGMPAYVKDTSVIFNTSCFTSPAYGFFEDRLKTFSMWPVQIVNPSPQQLAEAGFFYSGQSDIVKCFSCDVKVSQWMATDKPWDEHLKWSPNCVYIKMCGIKEGHSSVNMSSQSLFNPSITSSSATSTSTINPSTVSGNLGNGF